MLKQSRINIAPFYIVMINNLLHFPGMNIKIGDGNIYLSGILRDYTQYDLDGEITDIYLDDLYLITGNTHRLKGKVSNGRVSINRMTAKNNNSPLINLDIDINNGLWDDISFDKLSLSSKYQNRRVESLILDVYTPLGFLKVNGWLNIDLFTDSFLISPEDSINLAIGFDTFNL